MSKDLKDFENVEPVHEIIINLDPNVYVHDVVEVKEINLDYHIRDKDVSILHRKLEVGICQVNEKNESHILHHTGKRELALAIQKVEEATEIEVIIILNDYGNDDMEDRESNLVRFLQDKVIILPSLLNEGEHVHGCVQHVRDS